MPKLISFDIDGTLEVGEPPGKISLDTVREAKRAGCLIGSCSDRTISSQARIWKEHGIEVDFTVLKQQLGELKSRFQAEEYFHVGDTELDRDVSQQSGFIFVPANSAVRRFWGMSEYI